MPYTKLSQNNYAPLKQEAAIAQGPCEQLPGTILRIFIPAGAVINLLNLLEITSPSGICLIIRIPALGGNGGLLSSLVSSIQAAGGRVEVVG